MKSQPRSADLPYETEHEESINNGHEPILELVGISKTYTRADTPVLQNLDLRVYPGDMLAIIGPSGSGKSTLLNVLGLLDTPTHGSYFLRGRDITHAPTRDLDILRSRHLGFVFQDAHLLPHESVIRNVALPLRVQGVGLHEQLRISEETLTQLGLEHRLMYSGGALSGGERQRVRLALSLAQDASILLLDEPTTFLDICHQLEVLDLIARLRRARGLTVVSVLHDLEHAARYADRLVALSRGRIVADGDPAAVVTPQLLEEVFAVTGRVGTDEHTGRLVVHIDSPRERLP